MAGSRQLRFPDRYRSLRAHAIVWILLPLLLIISGLVAAGILSYRKVVVQLVLDHQARLASSAAANIDQVIDGYTSLLETLANNPDIFSEATETRTAALNQAAITLDFFNAGILLLDPPGNQVAEISSSMDVESLGASLLEIIATLQATQAPAISSVWVNQGGTQPLVLIAAPILDAEQRFHGALVGGIQLNNSRLADLIHKLVSREHGVVYLVDRQGQVFFSTSHGQSDHFQADHTFIEKALSAAEGGMRWDHPSGGRYLVGYAPVSLTGWSLVIQEPWEIVTTPARNYGILLVTAGLAACACLLLLGWYGVRRIVTPIQALSVQARQMVDLDGIEPLAESGIEEIDSLEHSFDHMAQQITSYRLGLRRYAGAITRKQEDERRHLARELHDETVQSLLAISRNLELESASESDPARLRRLGDMQKMVSETLAGVRQISRDLRPLVLEDLGLTPALQALVRSARQGAGAIPHIKLDIPPAPIRLNPQQELALYRITQEALTNARKHAQPTGMRVTLQVDHESIQLEIEDDGAGFQVPESLSELAQRGCFGLMGIQERVWEMGGSLRITSYPGEGTCLQVSMPVIALPQDQE